MTGILSADLSGKTALVTGASSGLGRRFSKVLANNGARVICAARRAEKLADTVEMILAENGVAEAVSLDIKDETNINAVVDAYPEIDILVNNAGIAPGNRILDWKTSDWDDVMDTNLRGAWIIAQAVAKQMVGRKSGGSIINIASILGERVSGGVMPYAVSKAGIVQLTKVMALELADKEIRVNAIAPGYIKTEMTEDFLDTEFGQKTIRNVPQRRYGEPEELDGPLLLLASDASKFMTGAFIAVDGGHLVSAL